MSMRHRENRWSIEPGDWDLVASDSSADPVTVTLSSPHTGGVLQISAYTNEKGDVTESDLLDFAASEVSQPERSQFGHFFGFTAERRNPEYLRFWWLANGPLMLFITFASDALALEFEHRELEEILSSLRDERAVL